MKTLAGWGYLQTQPNKMPDFLPEGKYNIKIRYAVIACMVIRVLEGHLRIYAITGILGYWQCPPFVHAFMNTKVHLPIGPSTCQSIYLSVHLSMCLPIYLSTYLCVYLSMCLPIKLSIYQSISISLSNYLWEANSTLKYIFIIKTEISSFQTYLRNVENDFVLLLFIESDLFFLILR